MSKPVMVVVSAGLAAEVILPWSIIWLSDIYMFDIPGWSLWPLFAGVPALSVLAVLVIWMSRVASKLRTRSWFVCQRSA